jgi:OOP family OmpA-OmpF porin
MKRCNVSGTLALFGLAAIASPVAVAAEPGGYGGVSIGRSSANIEEARITNGLLGAGFAATSITEDERDRGFKIFGGYQFNRNFAVEGGYFDLGKFSFTAATVPAGTLTGNIRVRGLNLDLVGILPFTEKFSAFGRVGVQYAKTKDSFAGTGAVLIANPNPSERDTNYKFGLGLQYDFTQSLGMRVEAERYRIKDAVGGKDNIDLVSVGLVFRFGAKTPTPAPVYQPAAQTPAPPVQAVTPPPPPREAVRPSPPPPPTPSPQAPVRQDRN